jgi:hypothetical protein
MIHVSFGNGKLHSSVLNFDPPATRTCPGVGVCMRCCYAFKAENWPHVLPARLENYGASLSDTFVQEMIAKIMEGLAC